jgi:hypothetical protein
VIDVPLAVAVPCPGKFATATELGAPPARLRETAFFVLSYATVALTGEAVGGAR